MPIFEYRCAKCGHVMEMLHKSLNAQKPKCEKCGAETDKLLSGFAVGKAAEGPACDSCSSLPVCGGCSGGACPMSMG